MTPEEEAHRRANAWPPHGYRVDACGNPLCPMVGRWFWTRADGVQGGHFTTKTEARRDAWRHHDLHPRKDA